MLTSSLVWVLCDVPSVSPEEAAMYHYRNKLSSSAPWFKTPDTTDSEYATQFFPQVRPPHGPRTGSHVEAEMGQGKGRRGTASPRR